MEEVQNKLLSFFTNEKLLKVVRSSLIGTVVLVLPALYFGLKGEFNLEALFVIDIGVLVLIVALSLFLATIETKTQCYDITCEYDDDLPGYHKSINENSQEIRKRDKRGKESLKWLSRYNKDQQKMYNELLTNEKIEQLEKTILSYRVSGKEKQAKLLEKEITNIKRKPLHDKSFVPYSIKKILNVDKNQFKFNKKKGNNEINVNPKQINWLSQILGLIVRSSGIGILGTIPFTMSDSISTIVWFYLGYIVLVSLTIIAQWLVTSYITAHSYKTSLIKIIAIQDELLTTLEPLPFAELDKDYSDGEIKDDKIYTRTGEELKILKQKPFVDLDKDYSKGEVE